MFFFYTWYLWKQDGWYRADIECVYMHVFKPSLVSRLCMRSYKHVNPFSLLEEDYKRLKHKHKWLKFANYTHFAWVCEIKWLMLWNNCLPCVRRHIGYINGQTIFGGHFFTMFYFLLLFKMAKRCLCVLLDRNIMHVQNKSPSVCFIQWRATTRSTFVKSCF